jgi:hypothetical protein
MDRADGTQDPQGDRRYRVYLETELAAKGNEPRRCRDAMSRLEVENARLRTELDIAVASGDCEERQAKGTRGGVGDGGDEEASTMFERRPPYSSKAAAAESPDGSGSGRARPTKDGMGGGAACTGQERRQPEARKSSGRRSSPVTTYAGPTDGPPTASVSLSI